MRSALLLPVIVHAHSIRVVLTVVYSARMFGERKRERDSVFRERKKGDTCEIEYTKKNVWSNRRILVLLVLSILSMDVIKNKK